MDVDEGSTSASSEGAQRISLHPRRQNAFYQFTQQSLPACKPVLTPAWVITAYLLMASVYITIGLFTLGASHSVNELMKAPIYIYYQLDNYYQNHRRYVKSRSDQQLLSGLQYNDTSSCKPVESNDGLPVVPCGLIAWSLFNDTFRFTHKSAELMVNRKNIAWKSDRDHKFGKVVYPFNFHNGTLTGGGNLDPKIPLSDQEDLIVWMHTAALPSFRKLYGRIEENLNPGNVVVVNLTNNYKTYSFGGKKKLVLSTSSWLGGKNDFLGASCIIVGFLSIIISVVFMVLHVKNPR